MKKLYYLYAAGLVALASCSSNAQKSAEATDATEETVEAVSNEVVYSGVLPAADTEGVEYTVNFVYNPDSETDGNFTMTQVYMSETDPATFDSKGTFAVKTGTPQSADQKYFVLAAESTPADTTYFVVTNDNTITLVGSDLTPSVTGLNYDLTKK